MIITNFKDNGIYVILDMHQDVASQQFETYDGFPAWLVEKLRTGAERQFPWPLAGIENWFCGYVTYEACHVFQGFYDNKYEAVDRLARVWAVIAQELGQFPNILGYNILNEPWAGNIYKDGSLILPAEVGRKNLAPMRRFTPPSEKLIEILCFSGSLQLGLTGASTQILSISTNWSLVTSGKDR